MGVSKSIRQVHRWTSIVFAVIVAAIFAMLGMGRELVEWAYLLPLAPLALLLVTGLYLFALPYIAKGRGAGAAE